MEAVTHSNEGNLQHMLQSAVQAVQWTYSLFWQFCPQQGILIWADGYYNGSIKTRKTVQPSMEISAEEVSLQRSQQLRELYDSLSAGESTPPGRRPSASLSPEDLTETEWFYLMCVSFSFPPGVGLPGKAYAKGQHVWLTGSNEVESKIFSRAILAKSALIQTVVCIPAMDGVVELGHTERVQEDLNFINQVKSFFSDHHHHKSYNTPTPVTPKPALSEHSTSNPTPSSSIRSHFHYSVPSTTTYTTLDLPPLFNDKCGEDEDDDDGADEADDGSGSEAQTNMGQAQPSELMQLEMSEDIRLGSPEDASNNVDSDFLSMSQQLRPLSHQYNLIDSFKVVESTRRWPIMQHQGQEALLTNDIQPTTLAGAPEMDELSHEDKHYSQTVSIILQFQTPPPSSSIYYSPRSAFTKWNSNSHDLHLPAEGTSQWLLKYILFTVPYQHAKQRDDCSIVSSPKPSSHAPPYTATVRYRPSKTGTPQDELSANHVLAERRRREKLNERFIILRSLVPFVTKVDKASILGDTIEYVKQLRKKIQELEAHAKEMELDHIRDSDPNTSVERHQISGSRGLATEHRNEKRKMRLVEDSSGSMRVKPKEAGEMLQVSIIENDALIELQSPYKEGLLVDVMLKLRDMRLEVTAVQSSLNNGCITAEIRAKVQDHLSGKKASIVEVKKAVYQIVPHTDS